MQEAIDRISAEKLEIETQAAEQAETCQQLTEANNTLSARALTLAEEAATSSDGVRNVSRPSLPSVTQTSRRPTRRLIRCGSLSKCNRWLSWKNSTSSKRRMIVSGLNFEPKSKNRQHFFGLHFPFIDTIFFCHLYIFIFTSSFIISQSHPSSIFLLVSTI